MSYDSQYEVMVAMCAESTVLTETDLRSQFETELIIAQDKHKVHLDMALYVAEWNTWQKFFLGKRFPGVNPQLGAVDLDDKILSTAMEVFQRNKNIVMKALNVIEGGIDIQGTQLSKARNDIQDSAGYTLTPEYRKKQLAKTRKLERLDKENKEFQDRVEKLEKTKNELAGKVTDLSNIVDEKDAKYNQLKQKSSQKARDYHNEVRKLKSELTKLKRVAEGDVDFGEGKEKKKPLYRRQRDELRALARGL